MGNYYYSQQLQEKGSIIDLVANENKNDITMLIADAAFNTTSAITLTEQEQDDLIVGILERRGISQKAYQGFLFGVKGAHYNPITAEGSEQSRIHPAKLPTR